MRLALLALVPVILIQSSVLTNGLHYISGVVESRCTLTACITVSISSTPALSWINLLIRTLLIIPLKLTIFLSVLGRRVGIQIISGTTRRALMGRALKREHFTASTSPCECNATRDLGSHNNQILLDSVWFDSSNKSALIIK